MALAMSWGRWEGAGEEGMADAEEEAEEEAEEGSQQVVGGGVTGWDGDR